MNYIFSQTKFNNNLVQTNKSGQKTIKHSSDKQFKLLPFRGSTKASYLMSETLENIAPAFIQATLGREIIEPSFDDLFKIILDEVEVRDEDINKLKELVSALFFSEGRLKADNVRFYPYYETEDAKQKNMAKFLVDVFQLGDDEISAINWVISNYRENAIEKLVIASIKAITKEKISSDENEKKYFAIFESAADGFKNDFNFMLHGNMTSPEDINNLLNLYYFFYTSQICYKLDGFVHADRRKVVPLYFALDWEKVSANRECCVNGWKNLQPHVNNLFSHVMTLELLNQIENDSEMFDYIKLYENVNDEKLDDHQTAGQIKLIENTYLDCLEKDTVDKIREKESIDDGLNETANAIRNLYNCVNDQFNITDRKRIKQAYANNLVEYYRKRWLKNRKKGGLVLNLTENDVIFLTKISIGNNKQIRLNDLFKEFEKRGVYLDNTSKRYLQEFYTKLNMLEKKSDSEDSQYVRQIL